MEKCKWCRCSLPYGMIATCFDNPHGNFCEAEEMESIADIAERVFPDEVQEIREHKVQHIDAERTIGPTGVRKVE